MSVLLFLVLPLSFFSFSLLFILRHIKRIVPLYEPGPVQGFFLFFFLPLLLACDQAEIFYSAPTVHLDNNKRCLTKVERVK